MQNITLRKILSALVDDFGYQEVRNLLETCYAEAGKGGAQEKSGSVRYNKPRVKPCARTVVESLKVDDDQKKKTLMILADEYEKKAFMPNMNNVRAFLAQQGQDTSRIKSRQQAVSAVFNCLAEWGTDSLRELHIRGTYGRPKSLSVIAESIESVGRQNRI
ncbi:MAG: hypothetical protein OXC26_25760 [Albidovulum sp.]|nr:hypothetical protein [Albidovulum sp.]